MSTITTQFGTGGANLAPADAQGAPSLATTLRDIADDLTGLVAMKAAAIASPNATDLATAITLANEIKTALNATVAPTLKTIKG